MVNGQRWKAHELTVGVEEEFLVVDQDGHVSRSGPEIVESAPEERGQLQRELTTGQVETASPVCRTAGELVEELTRLRNGLATAARDRQLRLLPSGTPLLAEQAPVPITPSPRFHRIAEHFGALVHTVTTCACHVHVGIPDREVGVQLINRLRRWLPLLLAMSGNSPFNDDRDTGYCSWRHMQWSQWPSAGPPPHFRSPDHYGSTVEAMLRVGAALDRGMVYWDIRLSEQQPTLEVRVADVAITARRAALYGVLVRALVGTALAELRDEGELPVVPVELLRTYLWRAARDGMEGECPDPLTGEQTSFQDQLDTLYGHIHPVLPAADADFVVSGLADLRDIGTGAQQQRAAFARRHCLRDVIDFLAHPPDSQGVVT